MSTAANETAREWLSKPATWPNGRMVLWGPAGHGKTHLLHIWARSCGALILSGRELRGLISPPTGPIAVDDADLAGDDAALLHVLNMTAEAGKVALLTAKLPPARQMIGLPDLASRLRASLAVELAAPDDRLLGALLMRLAAERQLVLGTPVRAFLLSRLPRTPAALREAVAQLDHAALATGGRVTRQMAASLLVKPTAP